MAIGVYPFSRSREKVGIGRRKTPVYKTGFWGVERRLSDKTGFWGVERRLSDKTGFWGVERRLSDKTGFWGVERRPSDKTGFWGRMRVIPRATGTRRL